MTDKAARADERKRIRIRAISGRGERCPSEAEGSEGGPLGRGLGRLASPLPRAADDKSTGTGRPGVARERKEGAQEPALGQKMNNNGGLGEAGLGGELATFRYRQLLGREGLFLSAPPDDEAGE